MKIELEHITDKQIVKVQNKKFHTPHVIYKKLQFAIIFVIFYI